MVREVLARELGAETADQRRRLAQIFAQGRPGYRRLYSRRSLEEVPYHLARAGEDEELVTWLVHSMVMEARIRLGRTPERLGPGTAYAIADLRAAAAPLSGTTSIGLRDAPGRL